MDILRERLEKFLAQSKNITAKECFNWTVSQMINVLPLLCSSPKNATS